VPDPIPLTWDRALPDGRRGRRPAPRLDAGLSALTGSAAAVAALAAGALDERPLGPCRLRRA
jgi:hypothetical protein